MYEVTALPVLLAGLANVIIGFIWYNPKVFGDAWITMSGLDREAMAKNTKMMPLMALIGLVTSIVMAYVLAHFYIAWGVWDWIGAAELSFWIWLGFVMPPALGVFLWEGKSFKLVLINAGFWFVSMIAMGVILISMQ